MAEILMCMVPLLNQLGVDTRWTIIKGSEDFFSVTRKLHNALHGRKENISSKDLSIFLEINKRNTEELKFQGDIIFIHDPQPVALIAKKKELGGKWIWRCHIDVSNSDKEVWEFVRNFVIEYDAAVFSSPNFTQQLPIRQFMISPSIDPLSDKNVDAIKRLLSNPEYASWLGKNAREHVRQNFLITRHLKDYLLLFISLYYDSDVIYL